MGRRKRSMEGVGPDTNVFGDFASAASAFLREHRKALEEVEQSGHSDSHKELLKDRLTRLLDERVKALCAQSHEALDAQCVAPVPSRNSDAGKAQPEAGRGRVRKIRRDNASTSIEPTDLVEDRSTA